MPYRTPYSPQIRAAVLAALATGSSVHAVAREFGIDRATVGRWKKAAGGMVHPTMHPKKETGETIGEQVYDFLEESIDTLRAQAQFTRNPEWLLQQDARSLALLHGVMFDKAARLLGALQPVDQPVAPMAGNGMKCPG